MVPDLFFYQLVLVALVWLCLSLAVEHRVIIVLEYLDTRLCRRLMWMGTVQHQPPLFATSHHHQ